VVGSTEVGRLEVVVEGACKSGRASCYDLAPRYDTIAASDGASRAQNDVGWLSGQLQDEWLV